MTSSGPPKVGLKATSSRGTIPLDGLTSSTAHGTNGEALMSSLVANSHASWPAAFDRFGLQLVRSIVSVGLDFCQNCKFQLASAGAGTDETARTAPNPGQLKCEILNPKRSETARNRGPKRFKNNPKPSETIRKRSETLRNCPKFREKPPTSMDGYTLMHATQGLNMMVCSKTFTSSLQTYTKSITEI